MSVPVPTTRSITYRSDLQVLIVRWQQAAPLAVLQADYHAMLAAAEAHHCPRWLLDVRRREGTDPELSAWASTHFYPLAAARFVPHRLDLAILTSSYLYQRFAQDPVQRLYVDFMFDPERPFRIHVFTEEATAMAWLLAT